MTIMQEIIDNFKEVVKNKYWCLEGRAGLKEFWLFYLANFVIGLIPCVGLLIQIVLIPPSISLMVRRLHDINKPGILALLALIPCVGLILIYFGILEGTKGTNSYGEPVPFLGKPPVPADSGIPPEENKD